MGRDQYRAVEWISGSWMLYQKEPGNVTDLSELHNTLTEKQM